MFVYLILVNPKKKEPDLRQWIISSGLVFVDTCPWTLNFENDQLLVCRNFNSLNTLKHSSLKSHYVIFMLLQWNFPPFFTETTVSCSETEYACSSGRCIPARWQCDREQDCDDGSDESEDICGKLLFYDIVCIIPRIRNSFKIFPCGIISQKLLSWLHRK